MNKGNKRVLVIDDNPDGEEALRLQRDLPAAVVITDIFMPGKEGIETIYGVDYFSVASELGAVKTFKKPFEPNELIQAVRELTLSD
jgi:CheY-like chemotaxis protein